MIKKQIIKINNGSYPFDTLICIGTSHKEIVSYFKRNKLELSDQAKDKLWMEGIGRTIMLENGAIIIRVEILDRKAEFHSNLAHEIFHAVEFLFERIEIKHNVDISGEAFAYQLGYLLKETYKNIYKK